MSDNNKYWNRPKGFLAEPEEDEDKLPDIVRMLEQQDQNEGDTNAYEDFIESLLSEQLRIPRRPGKKPRTFKKRTSTTGKTGSNKRTFTRKSKTKPAKVTKRKTRLDPKKPKTPKPKKTFADRAAAAGRITKAAGGVVAFGAAYACYKGASDAPAAENPAYGFLSGVIAGGQGCINALSGLWDEVFGTPETAVEKDYAKSVLTCYEKLTKHIYKKFEKEKDGGLKKIRNYKVTQSDLKAAGCDASCNNNLKLTDDGKEIIKDCVKDIQKLWDKNHSHISKDGSVRGMDFIRGLAPYLAYDIAKTNIDTGGDLLLNLLQRVGGAALSGLFTALAAGAGALGWAVKNKLAGRKAARAAAKNPKAVANAAKKKPKKKPRIQRPGRRPGIRRENVETQFPLLEILGSFSMNSDQSTESSIEETAKSVVDKVGLVPDDGQVSSLLYAIYMVKLFMEDPFGWNPMDIDVFREQADQELDVLGKPRGLQEFLRSFGNMDFSDASGSLEYSGQRYSLSDLGGDLSGEVVSLEKFGIQHNLEGTKKDTAEKFINQLYNLGITNKYSLAGALAVMGKESGFEGIEESSWYGYDFLVHGYIKNRKTGEIKNQATAKRQTVGNRIARIFRGQLGREPFESEWAQLSSDKSGKKAGIAMFNIAYGYSPYQNVPKYGIKQITMPVIVNGDSSTAGQINPALFDANLPGYKYRGRGPIQNTFAQNYASTSDRAGLPVAKILEDPGLLYREPTVGAMMSAGFIRNVLRSDRRRRNMESQFGFDAYNPTTLEQGIYLHAAIAGGGGARDMLVSTWFKRAVRKANAAAAKYIRVIEGSPGTIGENIDVN